MMLKLSKLTIWTAAVLFGGFCFADIDPPQVQVLEDQVHEAFLTSVGDTIILQAVDSEPPVDIQETTPQQTNEKAIWIPGYWSWNAKESSFVWISGLWRVPPPERQWIAGKWKHFDEGWVYLPGFWSHQPQEKLQTIATAPPASVEEKTTNPPGNDYFWIPGYWSYDSSVQKYTWLNGRWERLDPNWILVPAHYVWQEGGYVLVDAYWDWALKDRGTIYPSLLIPESLRAGYVSAPESAIDSSALVGQLFAVYPNYQYLYCWHYHYFPEFWVAFRFAPPWWSWNNWWTINSTDQWSLWWWWSHPGYPAPQWIDDSTAAKIAPPSKDLIVKMQKVQPPANVLDKGVLSPAALIGTLKAPILPSNPEKLNQIKANLVKGLPAAKALRPTGTIATVIADLPKPKDLGVEISAKELAPAKTPEKPRMTEMSEVFRTRPDTKDGQLKPMILQPVFPSQRPRLDAPRRVTKDVFKSNVPSAPSYSNPTLDRQNAPSVPSVFMPSAAPTSTNRPAYNPPQIVEPTSPYGETRYRYTPPQRSSYESPRSDYAPSSYRPSQSSPTFSGDIYSAPPSATYRATESIRAPSQRGNVFTPSTNYDGSDYYNPNPNPSQPDGEQQGKGR